MIEMKERTKEEENEEEEKNGIKKTTSCSRSSSSSSSSADEREYRVQDLRDRLKSSRGSRFNLIEIELGLSIGWRKFSRQALFHEFVIHPNNRLVTLFNDKPLYYS